MVNSNSPHNNLWKFALRNTGAETTQTSKALPRWIRLHHPPWWIKKKPRWNSKYNNCWKFVSRNTGAETTQTGKTPPWWIRIHHHLLWLNSNSNTSHVDLKFTTLKFEIWQSLKVCLDQHRRWDAREIPVHSQTWPSRIHHPPHMVNSNSPHNNLWKFALRNTGAETTQTCHHRSHDEFEFTTSPTNGQIISITFKFLLDHNRRWKFVSKNSQTFWDLVKSVIHHPPWWIRIHHPRWNLK